MVPMLNTATQSAMQAAGVSPTPLASQVSNGAPRSFDKVLTSAYAEPGNSTAPTKSQVPGTRSGQRPVSQSAARHGESAGSPTVPYTAVPILAPMQIRNAAQGAQQSGQNPTRSSGAGDTAPTGAITDLLERSASTTALSDDGTTQSELPTISTAAASGVISQSPAKLDAASATDAADSSPGTQTSASAPADGQGATPLDADRQPARESDVLLPDWSLAQTSDLKPLPADTTPRTQANSQTNVDSRSFATFGAAQSNSNVEGAGVESSAEGLSATRSLQTDQAHGSEDKSNTGSTTPPAESGPLHVQLLPVEASADTQRLVAGTATSSRGTVQAAASGSERQVVAEPQASGADHGGANSQGKDANTSNSDSAAAQTAGLAQASVGGPLHAPAVAAASAEASAGPAAAGVSAQAQAAQPSLAPAMTARSAAVPAPAPQPANDFLQASQLYQRVGGAEMHVAMNTEMLGSVDVHAVVRQSTVSATIGVQRPEVQTLLASDLPALQHALSEHSLHVEQISVLGGSAGGQTDSRRNAPQNQQNWGTPGGSLAGANGGSETIQNSATELPAAAMSRAAAAAGRLSIHV
jgi:hypothetical protein